MVLLYKIIFGVWLVCTVFWQFDRVRKSSKLLRTINILNVLPIWTFFAPNPGMYDTHILFRDKREDGSLSDWMEVKLVEERKWYHFLWNPTKRKQKMAVDAISEIKSIKISGEENNIAGDELLGHVKLSKGYLLMLNIVFSQARSDRNAVARQFIVLDASHASGERNLIPLFYSAYHRFGGV